MFCYKNNIYIYIIYLFYLLYIHNYTHVIGHIYIPLYTLMHLYIYALQYSTTAYTGLIPVVAIPMNQPVFHKISGCHWHAIGYGGHRPLRLLRLSRL